MLVITRYPEQTILIGDDVSVTVVGVKGKQVRLAIHAPGIKVDRYEKRLQENLERDLGVPPERRPDQR